MLKELPPTKKAIDLEENKTFLNTSISILQEELAKENVKQWYMIYETNDGGINTSRISDNKLEIIGLLQYGAHKILNVLED